MYMYVLSLSLSLSPSLQYNHHYDVVISADSNGILEYWSGTTHSFPKNISFSSKLDTDLYEFIKVSVTNNMLLID